MLLLRLAAEYPHSMLLDTLGLISCDWIELDQVRWIDPRRVLAQAWNPERLADARRLLEEGRAAPPIVVHGCYFKRDKLYHPEDGIHRTVVAREAGRKVKAKIRGYARLKPEAFVLAGVELLRIGEGDQRSRAHFICAVTSDQCVVLRALGVVSLAQRSAGAASDSNA
jgi:hypothetical protein